MAKLRQAEALVGQGKPVTEAVREIGVPEATHYRWHPKCGGLKLDQVGRLRRAVADRAVEQLALKEAASAHWQAPLVARRGRATSGRSSPRFRPRRAAASPRTGRATGARCAG